jgi:hypothetical protein
MKNTVLLWIVAFLITAGSAVYQRLTGPTYPIHGMTSLAGKAIPYVLLRSEEQRNARVMIPTGDASITGALEWRRFRTEDPWTTVSMTYQDSLLSAELPVQPPAGKLEYRVRLTAGEASRVIPESGSTIIRFKGNVPLWVLIPHILVMFLGMLFSTRAGLEIVKKEPDLKWLSYWTLGFLVVGGLVFGPVMQKFAFDSYWTGWPFGTDLTDNKTAIAVLAWVAALVAVYRSRRAKWWAFGAAIVVLAVFMIPHSVLGSELDYSKMDRQKTEQTVPLRP